MRRFLIAAFDAVTMFALSPRYDDSMPRQFGNVAAVRYCRVYRPTRHIIGHFADDFTGQMTQPTV